MTKTPMRPPAGSVFDEVAAAYLGRDYVDRTRAAQQWRHRRDHYMDVLVMVTLTLISAALAACAVGLAVLTWGWAL